MPSPQSRRDRLQFVFGYGFSFAFGFVYSFALGFDFLV
jgi:hypothetical protein